MLHTLAPPKARSASAVSIPEEAPVGRGEDAQRLASEAGHFAVGGLRVVAAQEVGHRPEEGRETLVDATGVGGGAGGRWRW